MADISAYGASEPVGPGPVAGESAPISRGYLLANRIGGALVLALGLYIAIQGLAYGFLVDGLPSAGFYPVLVGALLAFLGGSLVVVAKGEARLRGDDSTLPDRQGVITLSVTFVMIVLFLVLLGPLGYVGSMFLFVFGVLRAASRQRTWLLLVIAVAFSVGTFYAFDVGLGVPLPHSHLLPLAWLGF